MVSTIQLWRFTLRKIVWRLVMTEKTILHEEEWALTYSQICESVEKLRKKYDETDPFNLCRAMGIILLMEPMGIAPDDVKVFFLNKTEYGRLPSTAICPGSYSVLLWLMNCAMLYIIETAAYIHFMKLRFSIRHLCWKKTQICLRQNIFWMTRKYLKYWTKILHFRLRHLHYTFPPSFWISNFALWNGRGIRWLNRRSMPAVIFWRILRYRKMQTTMSVKPPNVYVYVKADFTDVKIDLRSRI